MNILDVLEAICELLKIILIALTVFLTVTIFWQWLEFNNYGEIRPSDEDSIMTLVITWLSVELYMCKKKGNKNEKEL